MSITPSLYGKARAEIVALFGWDADSLSPDQTLRVDCAVALRLALDDLQGRIVRGESADVARMLTASEALARLLPPAVLSTPPAEEHGDPREVMWRIYSEMRTRGEVPPEGWHQHRINELEGENGRLRAQLVAGGLAPALPPGGSKENRYLGGTGSSAIDVPTADIVPASERAECDRGPSVGLDDPPKPPVTIEGKDARAVPPPRPAWEDWLNAGAGVGPGYDRWADNR